MAAPKEKLVTPGSLLLDAILVIAFFAFMYTILAPHVPSRNPSWQLFWGAACSSCLTGVFWLCIQMFRIVLRVQIQLNRERAQRVKG